MQKAISHIHNMHNMCFFMDETWEHVSVYWQRVNASTRYNHPSGETSHSSWIAVVGCVLFCSAVANPFLTDGSCSVVSTQAASVCGKKVPLRSRGSGFEITQHNMQLFAIIDINTATSALRHILMSPPRWNKYIGIYLCRFNIWHVNYAQTIAFLMESPIDKLEEVSKYLRQKMPRSMCGWG